MFQNYIFFLKQKMIRRLAYKNYKNAIFNESLSCNQLAELNWNKRKELVNSVYKTIPFYKAALDNVGFKPGDIKTEGDWHSLPILRKEDIRENASIIFNSLINSKYARKITTGGSTGVPLTSYRDRRFNDEILQWRTLSRFGAIAGSNIAMLWRIPPSEATFSRRLFNKLIWFPTIRLKYDASSLNNKSLNSLISDINKYKTKIIWGYTGALEQLMQHCLRKQIQLDSVNLVWSTASPLTEILRAQFQIVCPNAKLLDQYACSEIHFVAANCNRTSDLHVDSDYRHIDIVNGDTYEPVAPETYGDILLTDFENRIFPLIRYKVGDRSSFTGRKCICGRPHPLIKPVKGRVSDNIILKNGTTLTGEYLTTLFDDYTNLILKFQIIYSENQSLLIKTVVKPGVSQRVVKKMQEEVFNTLLVKTNGYPNIKFKTVEDIPHHRGKFKFIVSQG